MNLLKEYYYVKKVVHSCVTEEQLDVAKKWAEDWCIRAKKENPNDVLSATDLYLDVISK